MITPSADRRCHQLGGVGSPGVAPPLVDGELWGALGDKAERYFAGVLIGGLSGTIAADGEVFHRDGHFLRDGWPG